MFIGLMSAKKGGLGVVKNNRSDFLGYRTLPTSHFSDSHLLCDRVNKRKMLWLTGNFLEI
jgi:hypothetical protein